MKVLKFGGTSVGTAQKMKEVARLINDGSKKMVVLSAMAGATNQLVKFNQYLGSHEFDRCKDLLSEIRDNYHQVIDELLDSQKYKNESVEGLGIHFDVLKKSISEPQDLLDSKIILSQGELISTFLFSQYLKEQNIKHTLLSAFDYMVIDQDGEPEFDKIKENFGTLIHDSKASDLYITQGFICSGFNGEVSNFGRGGSDYSASIIAAAIGADLIQIWTDIDGMHNNDPRYVKNTHSISRLSFDEAAELAYFGAKILHPSSIQPAKRFNIPVSLKNTMEPQAEGTLISHQTIGDGIKAIAAKDNITAIKIQSGRMLLAYGFLRTIFEVFEKFRTPIDMITTSEVAVSLTVDNTSNLDPILEELNKYGHVEISTQMTIICIVGNFISAKKGIALQIFEKLQNVPIRMISYGGSNHNVSILVNTKDKLTCLNQLNELFL